jgi:hypothetical protein
MKPMIDPLPADVVGKRAAEMGGETDLLTVIAAIAFDSTQDVGIRLSAANCCLPYMYSKLSSVQVDSRVTVTRVDGGDLLRRLDERLSKLSAPRVIEAVIEPPDLVVEGVPDEAV